MVEELSTYLRGWHRYFGFCQTPSVLLRLDTWLRHRLRSVVWKQWKRERTRFAELRKRDINVMLAAKAAGSAHGPWRLAASPALSCAPPMLTSTPSDFLRWRLRNDPTRRTAGCGPACPVVWQGRAGNRAPYADLSDGPGLGQKVPAVMVASQLGQCRSQLPLASNSPHQGWREHFGRRRSPVNDALWLTRADAVPPKDYDSLARIGLRASSPPAAGGEEAVMNDTSKLTKADLEQFTGTDHYYRHSINRHVLFTDGVKALAD